VGEVTECHHCREVFQGGQADSFVQGRLEHPRNASQVQRNCLLVQTVDLSGGGGHKPVVHHLAAPSHAANNPVVHHERNEGR
jgi:hypothetical protein